MEEQSPYHKKKKILDFIADGVASKWLSAIIIELNIQGPINL